MRRCLPRCRTRGALATPKALPLTVLQFRIGFLERFTDLSRVRGFESKWNTSSRWWSSSGYDQGPIDLRATRPISYPPRPENRYPAFGHIDRGSFFAAKETGRFSIAPSAFLLGFMLTLQFKSEDKHRVRRANATRVETLQSLLTRSAPKTRIFDRSICIKPEWTVITGCRKQGDYPEALTAELSERNFCGPHRVEGPGVEVVMQDSTAWDTTGEEADYRSTTADILSVITRAVRGGGSQFPQRHRKPGNQRGPMQRATGASTTCAPRSFVIAPRRPPRPSTELDHAKRSVGHPWTVENLGGRNKATPSRTQIQRVLNFPVCEVPVDGAASAETTDKRYSHPKQRPIRIRLAACRHNGSRSRPRVPDRNKKTTDKP